MLSETPPSRRDRLEKLFPIIVGLAGLAMAHHPMAAADFGRIQGESGDSRFINYLLEHSYRWVRSEPIHRVFWDPPFYYPATNVAAHSDLLVGAGFPYWAFRTLGVSPDSAFQIWMIAVSALNYLCGYLLFRGGFHFGKPAAAASAFLVAFGAPRINHYVHQQLFPCFYVLLAIYALVRIFSGGAASPAGRFALWLLAALATVGQLYSGFYQGWFLIWSTVLAIFAALILPACRQGLFRVLARDAWAILTAAAVAGVILWPLFAHYSRAARELHQGYYPMRPSFWSWLNVGPYHWLWGWTANFEVFRNLPTGIEDRLSIGHITPLFCAAGLWLGRRGVACRLAILVLLGWFLCISNFPVWGDYLSALALLIAAMGLAVLFRERDQPGDRILVALGLVVCLNLIRFLNIYALLLGVYAVGLVVVEIVRRRDDPARLVGPWLVLLGLCVPVFFWQMLLVGLTVVLPLWALAEYLRISRIKQVRAAAAVVLVAFLALVNDRPHQPYVLAMLVLGPPLMLAATAKLPRRILPPARIVMWVTLAAIPAMVYCYQTNSIWTSIVRDVPGAPAIRGVGRLMLFLVVPLGVGLATFLSKIEEQGKTALAWSIGLFCLLEQGMTTPTYDKQEQRDRVEKIAAQVDPNCEAFFYHTRRDGSWVAYVNYQIDAMWASLDRKVPTINGYSSVWPRDWIDLRLCAFLPDSEVREALYGWARSRNLDLHRIEWINEDSGPMRFSPFFGSKPGDPPVPGAVQGKEEGLSKLLKP